MARPEDGNRVGLHLLDILLDQCGIVIGSGTIWPCNQDHHRLGRICDHGVFSRTERTGETILGDRLQVPNVQ